MLFHCNSGYANAPGRYVILSLSCGILYGNRKFIFIYYRLLFTSLLLLFIIILFYYLLYGPGSSVGIATELRAGRSGIESRWGRDFPPVQTGPGAHPASCTMGTGSFPAVKCGWGMLLTTHPLLVPRSWKSRAIPLPTLWATPGLQRKHFTFTMYYRHPVPVAARPLRLVVRIPPGGMDVGQLCFVCVER